MPSEQKFSKKLFLIADDSDAFRSSIKVMLHRLGIKSIDTACVGREAVLLYKQKCHDVVMMDYNFGRGTTGQQILSEMVEKNILKRTSIFLMVTAEVERGAVMSTLEYRPDDYIAKPFTFSELSRRLEKAVKYHGVFSHIYSAMDRKQFDRALEFCEENIRTGCSYKPKCLRLKADVLSKMKRFTEARAVYQASIDEFPQSASYLGLGEACFKLKQFDEAIDAFGHLKDNEALRGEAFDWIARAHEEMGQYIAAEAALTHSVTASPRTLRYQKRLAALSHQNDNLEKATQAYKQTIKLSKHTEHDVPENQLKLADCLSDWSDSLAGSKNQVRESNNLAHESVNILTSVNQSNKTEDTLLLKSNLVLTRAYTTLKNKPAAKQALSESLRLKELVDDSDPEILLAFIKTYSKTDPAKVEGAIADFLVTHQGDEEAIEQLERLTGEPVTDRGKDIVKELNQKGKKLFSDGLFGPATEEFDKALSLYPKHISLNLNMVQALLELLKQTHDEYGWAKKCQSCLDAASVVQESHPEFGRFQHLKRQFAEIPKFGIE